MALLFICWEYVNFLVSSRRFNRYKLDIMSPIYNSLVVACFFSCVVEVAIINMNGYINLGIKINVMEWLNDTFKVFSNGFDMFCFVSGLSLSFLVKLIRVVKVREGMRWNIKLLFSKIYENIIYSVYMFYFLTVFSCSLFLSILTYAYCDNLDVGKINIYYLYLCLCAFFCVNIIYIFCSWIYLTEDITIKDLNFHICKFLRLSTPKDHNPASVSNVPKAHQPDCSSAPDKRR